jgi:hypothetical protein
MYSLTHYQLHLSRALTTLGVVSALCVFLYGIFLLMAVSHTASRAEAQRTIDAISAHVSELESQYLSEQRTLTPEYAQTLGFVEPTHRTVVYAHTTEGAITINTNR